MEMIAEESVVTTHIRLHVDLVKAIDRARGPLSRAMYLDTLLGQRLPTVQVNLDDEVLRGTDED